ncbi:MAG TPA: M14 metallopeptidase family protein [Pirellulaceae bacterium]
MRRASFWPAMAGLLLLVSPGWAQKVISPAEHLGHPVGADFKLPGWKVVSDYYRHLASESPHVKLESVGKTTEGRDFLVATISSEENLDRLDEIKRYTKQIADPRGLNNADKRQAVARGKVVLFITPAMHSTEVAATQMGMEFAWLLATSEEEPWKTARQTTVVVMTPTLNPDGLDHVSEWYLKNVQTPYEGTALPKLYQYYTGHDNNRDWFMLTQAETRHLSKLIYQDWHPQILWDVHQQGNLEERMFVPPFKDPLNANIDPLTVAAVNLVGTRAVLDMTRDGLTGIATGVSYDNWYVGGNRNVPTRHHIIGILTEAASANLASPVFQPATALKNPLGKGKYDRSNQFVDPWPGGWWRVRNIIDYELAFGRSLLSSINREPRLWLSNAMRAAERSMERAKSGTQAWLIPNDNLDRSAVRRLIEALLGTGVEVHVSKESFSADGREYPAGTIVLRTDQPYGGYVKDLFELQKFPPEEKPYDTCGWTLPLLLGVRRVEVIGELKAELQLATTAEEALAGFRGDERVAGSDGELLSSVDGDSWTAVVRDLQASRSVRLFGKGSQAGLFNRGDATSTADDITSARMPRIGVYAPWTGSMDEGWLRWTLDHFKIPFVTVRNETVRAGELRDLVDVLVIPDVTRRSLDDGRELGSAPSELTGGLAPEGAIAIEAFVREGGKLVAWADSCSWVVEQFGLPVVEVTGESSGKGFLCPGSVLRGVVEPNRMTAGLPHDVSVFFDNSKAWREMTKAEMDKGQITAKGVRTLLRYAPNRLLLSGKVDQPEVIEGRSAWISARHGDGTIHLFGFSPHFRGWTQQTMHLLFRALILSEASEADRR